MLPNSFHQSHGTGPLSADYGLGGSQDASHPSLRLGQIGLGNEDLDEEGQAGGTSETIVCSA